MAAARLAPELSATSRMERICSMAVSSGGDFHRLGVAFDDFHKPPTFGFRQRPAFLDANAVAGLGFALLVVRIELVERRHDLLEPRVREAAFDADDDGL